MSYLALNAAPFSTNTSSSQNPSNMMEYQTENDDRDNLNAIERSVRNRQRNKTIKNNHNPKVQNMMENIHNTIMESDNSGLGDFSPPANPISIGAERKGETEQKHNYELPPVPGSNMNGHTEENSNVVSNPLELDDDSPVTKDLYNEMHENNQLDDYYRNSENDYLKHLQTHQPQHAQINNRDELSDKLNYMIHLLEEHKDERVGNVSEELILYSFLGIFIIFVVDSFAKAGKYIR